MADEDEYLEYVTNTSPAIRAFDLNDPSTLVGIPSLVDANQETAQAIDSMRHFLGYDRYTGEEIYRYLMPEDLFQPMGRTWLFDFNNNDFVIEGGTPKKWDGGETNDYVLIAQWIMRALNTERYRYDVYPDWYGVELQPVWMGDLVGIPALNHVRNEVTSAIMMHDRVTAVDNVEVAEDGGTITLSCDVFLDNHEKAYGLSIIGRGGEFISG